EPAVSLPDLARRRGGGHAEHRVVITSHHLLLLSEILELRVDDLTLFGARRAAGGATRLRARALIGRPPRLRLRLPVHDFTDLLRGLRQRLLCSLHAVEVLRLERLLGLG